MKSLTLAGLLLFQVPPQPVTLPEYVVVFEVIQKNPGDAVVRINVLVRGSSEGDAAIAAFRYVQDLINDTNKIRYVEACLKPTK
jgi:hypothetical protein